MERVVVRSFGSVAAVAAAALALMIGFLAFSAHQNNQRATPPPGSQAAGPVVAHGRTTGVASGSTAAQSSRTSGAVPGSSGGRGDVGAVFVASGGSGGGQLAPSTGGGAVCNPGVVQTLLGAIGSLLGGGGASC
jgi:hypothetical protein